MTRSRRAVAVIVGAVLFASYAYFYEAGGWNQNSRFALVRAVLERHTLQVDAYQNDTGDRALWHGHYYSDKAPGASLLAIAPVAAARVVSRMAGVDPASLPGIAWTSYVATVATSAVFTVIAALLLFWLSLRWGATGGAAAFAAIGYGLATPAWAYATLFMGHAQTAGCLMMAFAAAVALDDASPAWRNRFAWVIGLTGGWAVVTEFPAGIPAILIGLLALDRVRSRDRRALVPVIARIALGVTIAAIPLLLYDRLAFDSMFHIGYASEEGFKEMQAGFFGITYPKPAVIVELLIGRFRGLWPLAPLTLLAPLGLVWLARAPRSSRAALVAGAIPVYYLLLNASYFYWEGGWAYGPRQMTPAFPFLCLGLAPLWMRWRRFGRPTLVVALAWGVALTLIAVSTTPQPPADFKAPVTELLLPAFRDGDLSLNHQSFVTYRADAGRLRGGQRLHAAWNLGELMGLHGLPSLLPLGAMWIAGAAALLL